MHLPYFYVLNSLAARVNFSNCAMRGRRGEGEKGRKKQKISPTRPLAHSPTQSLFHLISLLLFTTLIFTSGVHAKELNFAVIGKSVHPYWSEVELGTKAAASALNLKVNFFVPTKEDVAQQVSTLENFMAKGVDGIAFAASDPEAVNTVVKIAIQKGIPCITLDTDAPKTGRHVYIGTGNYQAGKIAGEKMVELLGGKGKVAIGVGSITARNAIDRIEGFKEALTKRPGIQVVETVVDKEDPATAVSQAEAVLQKYPDLAGFYGVYAINGPAAARAIKSAKKAGKIKIVCFDTTPDIMTLVKEGTIQATIGQKPYLMGYLSVAVLHNMTVLGLENALRMLPESRIIDTGVSVVTSSTIEKYRKEMQGLGIPVKF